MVHGPLNNTVQTLLSPSMPGSAPAPVPAAVATQASAQASQQTQSNGVLFDLSDKALQMVEEVGATLAVSQAAQSSGASASAGATQAPAGSRSAMASAAMAAEAEATDRTAAHLPAEADPSEEARARAWAIRGMERESLQNLIDTLKVTPKADLAEKEVAAQTVAQPYVQAAPAAERFGDL